jgi:hypothetical protein
MPGTIANRLDALERTQGHSKAPCGCDLGVRVIEDDQPEPESPWLCPHGHRYAEELLVHINHDRVLP